MAALPSVPHFPGLAQIDAYGRGGFRFAEMSHRGSLLCLPSGIWAWSVTQPVMIDDTALAPVAAESQSIDLFILGAGTAMWVMPESLRWWLRDLRIGVEVLATGAAVRTYNVLLGERRRVAAGLIAVD